MRPVAEALAAALPRSLVPARPTTLYVSAPTARRVAELLRVGVREVTRRDAVPIQEDVADLLRALDIVADVGTDVGMPAGSAVSPGNLDTVEGWLRVGQAARVAGIGRKAMQGRIARGTVSATRTPRGWLVDPASIRPKRTKAA